MSLLMNFDDLQDGAALAVRKWHLNEAFCTGRLAPLASVYVPLAPPSHAAAPRLHFSPDIAFESSGILAAALDTATMPYRLERGATPTGLGPATGMPRTCCFCLLQHAIPSEPATVPTCLINVPARMVMPGSALTLAARHFSIESPGRPCQERSPCGTWPRC